jgi:hypothetical protein
MKLVLQHLGVHAFEISVALLPHRQQSLQLEPVMLAFVVQFEEFVVRSPTNFLSPQQLSFLLLVGIEAELVGEHTLAFHEALRI